MIAESEKMIAESEKKNEKMKIVLEKNVRVDGALRIDYSNQNIRKGLEG